jgi:hypothetical protein
LDFSKFKIAGVGHRIVPIPELAANLNHYSTLRSNRLATGVRLLRALGPSQTYLSNQSAILEEDRDIGKFEIGFRVRRVRQNDVSHATTQGGLQA